MREMNHTDIVTPSPGPSHEAISYQVHNGAAFSCYCHTDAALSGRSQQIEKCSPETNLRLEISFVG